MKTARDIYEAYRIMPSLQLHQLRVAAVGKLICDNFNSPNGTLINQNEIVLACLFHDMGNIIKSDFSVFPKFSEPEGVAHWQSVKEDFIKEYGKDEHVATARIAHEIGLSDKIRQLINGVGFSKLEIIRDVPSFEQKIIEYSDLRVGPYNVLSLSARIAEAKVRYVGKHPDMPRSEDTFATLVAAAYEIEKQLCAACTIAPEDITDASVAPGIEKLRDYPID